ncbi:centrosomal protein of 68 kDa isoform X2 [Cheilinus undulatus]|uniref:centrosomal protein of 68 kDa isoform X2 n=1 Tax=Cheilinus undulatus TaxID=241271 RepID=UPI001BD39A70|nr:centrosomal protein of 68 kDa isoform X2 [Cheilinus undulatus]
MEAEGCSQQWKMKLPHSRRCSSPTSNDCEKGKTERERDRAGSHKSVSMAPTSRYLTDRQYVVRKPLFAAEQHTSILKKTHPQNPKDKVKQFGVSKREENLNHVDSNLWTRDKEAMSPEMFRLSHGDFSIPSVSKEDLDSPLGVSELRSSLFHEGPSFRSSLSGSRSAQRSFTSSILEVQRLNPPLRPRLTSTVLHPTYTPLSGRPRGDQAHPRLGGREGGVGGETKRSSSERLLKEKTMSPHQANYWACAIPKSLPPSPDRHSRGWDPNREYETLLDYTYPLRAGHVSEWDSTDHQEDSLLQTDPNLQDSGIDLDHLCSSPSLSGLGNGQTRRIGPLSEGPQSPDLQGSTRSLDDHLSLTDPVGLSVDSLDCCRHSGRINLCRQGGRYHQHHAVSSSTSAAFRRSTSVLPRSRCTCRELDDEFWPLPDQLEELQLLSRQVKEVTAQLSRPVTASWESLGPGTTSVLSSVTLPDKQEAEDKELEGNNGTGGKDETDREERRAALTADHRASEAERTGPGPSVEPAGGGLNLREVEALVEQLSGLTLPSSQRSSQENQRQRDSLMQHIKVFCSHLEQLIRRLYAVSEKMELLAAPTVDIDSVKSSLAEYQSFQREVSSHQPLVSCVLHTGRLLLSCINTTSPFLREALLLIERQSGALENHTEHFFSSILSAMDSLTAQPGPVQQSREEDSSPVGIQGST